MNKSTIKNAPNPTSSGSGEGKHDLIDRQAALDALRSCQTYLYSSEDPDKKIALQSAEVAIEDLPSVQPDHTADISKKASISCAHENDVRRP